MEIGTLPNNANKTAEKTYKHFTIPTTGPAPVAHNLNQAAAEAAKPLDEKPSEEKRKEAEPAKPNEFFYIGKNSKKIDFLVRTFESGYAVESVDKAINILLRIAEKKNIRDQNIPDKGIPDIIIFDGSLGENALKQLNLFLISDVSFALVPFIMDASEISEQELKKYTKLQFLDEIIFLEEAKDSRLLSKVEFLKKVKKQPNKQLVKRNIEKGITGGKFIAKRLFDIVVSSIAIVLLLPVFLIVAIIIKFESRGPIFYVAQRAGRGYHIFNFFKFRTMVVDADKKVDQLSHLNQYNGNQEAGPVFFKISNDPRITRVGAFLRNTSLDELPQLFNVLLGDMSLVGNRPLPLYEAATLTTDQWAARFLAPAGITGLWQITKRGHNEMSVDERIKLDISYAEKYSFWNDLVIMAQTPFALVQKSNV